MTKIFISYRSGESTYASLWIYDALKTHFGEKPILRDPQAGPEACQSQEEISAALGNCNLLLAMIDDHWLQKQTADGRRCLDDPDDIVRFELETAFKQKIPVLPVLIGTAVLPTKDELPVALRELASQKAAEFRPGTDNRVRLERLATDVELLLKQDLRSAGSLEHPVGSILPNETSLETDDENEEDPSALRTLELPEPGAMTIDFSEEGGLIDFGKTGDAFPTDSAEED